ncbi:MAG: hypothetical protein L6Q71_04460 [Planctomycetes bacterium]|nr:hypothetical protein [Planctomycetota bacterium]
MKSLSNGQLETIKGGITIIIAGGGSGSSGGAQYQGNGWTMCTARMSAAGMC